MKVSGPLGSTACLLKRFLRVIVLLLQSVHRYTQMISFGGKLLLSIVMRSARCLELFRVFLLGLVKRETQPFKFFVMLLFEFIDRDIRVVPLCRQLLLGCS